MNELPVFSVNGDGIENGRKKTDVERREKKITRQDHINKQIQLTFFSIVFCNNANNNNDNLTGGCKTTIMI
jgi:hypothetical protein